VPVVPELLLEGPSEGQGGYASASDVLGLRALLASGKSGAAAKVWFMYEPGVGSWAAMAFQEREVTLRMR
jgi:hypothetical protein